MRIYKSCKELSIYLFNEIVSTGDIRHLIVDWDGKSNGPENLNDVWISIYEEYCDLTNDNSSLVLFKLKIRLAYLESKYYMANQLLLQMISREDMTPETFKKYIHGLSLWGIEYKSDKFNLEAIKEVKRHLRAIQNEISLKKKKVDEFKGGEPVPLAKQVVQMEQALGRDFIDPKNTSVEKWVFMIDAVKQMNQQRSKTKMAHGR